MRSWRFTDFEGVTWTVRQAGPDRSSGRASGIELTADDGIVRLHFESNNGRSGVIAAHHTEMELLNRQDLLERIRTTLSKRELA